jgi:hypothetical protein
MVDGFGLEPFQKSFRKNSRAFEHDSNNDEPAVQTVPNRPLRSLKETTTQATTDILTLAGAFFCVRRSTLRAESTGLRGTIFLRFGRCSSAIPTSDWPKVKPPSMSA